MSSELTATNTDCNDALAPINPGATESVADGVDSTCDGIELCYRDDDGDGYGDSTTINSTDLDCTDTVESIYNTDCDETDILEYPGQTRWKDIDGDNYGDGVSQTACERPTNYYHSSELISTTADCEDTDAVLNPTTPWYLDSDGDGYGVYAS